jgi:SAM-dependent methyltransferase
MSSFMSPSPDSPHLSPRPLAPRNAEPDTLALARKARFWDRTARQYAADPIADLPAYERTLARTLTFLHGNCRVLEIGCGTGSTALRLAPACASYRATDVSAQMIAIARDKLAQAPVGSLGFAVADADAPQDPDGAEYDRVLAFNVLHLVDDLDGTIAGCVRALAAGGLLISKIPCLREMNWLIPHLAVPLARLVGKAPPVLNLNEANLVAAMRRCGLHIVAVERHASRGRDVRPFIVARKGAAARPLG